MFNQFNKQIVAAGIVFTLTLNWSFPARSDNEEFHRKANEYVRLTQEGADSIALQLIQGMLFQMIVNGQGGDVQGIANASIQMQNLANEIQNGALAQLTQQRISLDELLAGDANLNVLRGRVREYLQGVSKLEKLNFSFEQGHIDAQLIQKSTSMMFKKLVNQMQPYCDTGIAIDVQKPHWQSIPAILPEFEVFVGAKFSTEDGSYQGTHDDTKASLSILKDPEANKAVGALLFASSVILGEYLVTGNLVLTSLATGGAGAAGGGAAISMAGLAVGAGIFLAVVAIAYIVMDQKARREANKILDSNKKIFYKAANSETVRSKFKAHCQNTVDAIRSAQNLFEGMRSNDTQSKSKFESMKTNVVPFLDELNNHLQALEKAKSVTADEWIKANGFEKNPFSSIAELESQLRDLKRESNRLASNAPIELKNKVTEVKSQISELKEKVESLYDKFDDLPEQEAYGKFMKHVTLDQLSEVLQVTLIESSLGVDQMSSQLMASLDQTLSGFKMEDIRKQAVSYVGALQILEAASIAQGSDPLLKKMKAEKLLSESLKEYDALLLIYIALAFAQPSPDVDIKLARVKTDLRSWYKNFVKTLQWEGNSVEAATLIQNYKFIGEMK